MNVSPSKATTPTSPTPHPYHHPPHLIRVGAGAVRMGGEGPCGRPICIKLRTAELWIAQLLEGTRGVLPPVRPAIGSHRGTHHREHHLPGDLSSNGQNQPRHRPLDHLPSF